MIKGFRKGNLYNYKNSGGKMYYIYMIRCKDNSIYTGITTDMKRRWQEHLEQGEKCAKYTKNHPVLKIEAVWQTEARVEASKLEYQIKTLTKKEKEKLIQNRDLTEFFIQKLECQKYKAKI